MELTIEKLTVIYQIILFQFVATSFFRNISYKLTINRNRKWVKSNPNVLLEYPKPNGLSHFFAGVILIALTLWIETLPKSPLDLGDINLISAGLMLLYFFITDCPLNIKLTKIIPKEVTVAVLKKRTLSNYMNPLFLVFIVFLILGNYIFAYSLGRFVSANTYLLVYIVLCPLLFVSSLRKPIHHDLNLDEKYRQIEIKTITVVLLTTVLVQFLKLMQFARIITMEKFVLGSLDSILVLSVFGYFMYTTNKLILKLPKDLA